MKRGLLIGIIVIILLVLLIVYKVFNSYKIYEYKYYETNGKETLKKLKCKETKEETNYVMLDTSRGLIFIKLYPDIAPITVTNFKKLIKDDFYNNLIFHRVINNFMIQTGGFTSSGYKTDNETIKGEFLNNGVTNNLSHVRGIVSMARADSMDSASSQFFIVHKNSTYLDGNYAAFGKVIAGMEVVDSIAIVKTDENDKPIIDIKLNSITFVNIRGEI